MTSTTGMTETNDQSPNRPASPVVAKRPSLVTEHLANERTFLAWIRTSLAMTGFGFAVAKLGPWLREMSGQSDNLSEASRSVRSTTAGMVMIIAGGLFAVLAAWRHRVVGRQIESGHVKPAGATMLVVTVMVLMLTVAVSYLILSGNRR